MRAKLVENQNFERGSVNEPSDLGLGQWKEIEEIVVPLHEFEENGGILEKGREIWKKLQPGGAHILSGHYLQYDSNQKTHLMYNTRYTSVPVPPGSGVKVKTKVLYK